MFDKIFGQFGMLAIGVIAFVVLIIGGLYVTIGNETTDYDNQIETGTTSLPTP
jgi:hypothetical protein